MITDRELLDAIASEKIPWRGVDFPSRGAGTITQQESVLVLRPTEDLSVVEANVWGQLMYSHDIERLIGGEGNQFPGIPFSPFLGTILAFLEYARGIYRRIGYNGPLLIRTCLKRVRAKPIIYSPNGSERLGSASQLDDEISFDISSSAAQLIEKRNEVAADLLKLIFFSLNSPDNATSASPIEALLNETEVYNKWR